MAFLTEVHNSGSRSTILDCEVESAIADATASSLSAATAATVALHKINGATREQLLTAAIHVIREQANHHDETVDNLADEIADREQAVDDLEIRIEDLRTKLKKAGATP